jgi:hypothetical protein
MHSLNWIAILGLVSLSCINMPLAVNSYQIQPGEVQFQDDFSDPSSGWARRFDENIGRLDYENQGYQISINQSNTILWSGPGLEFTDVQIEVDGTKIDGPEHDDFGVVCRARDEHNFYFLIISSDGYYGIGKVRDGIQQLIGMNDMPPSEDIIQGQYTNHLRADCIGEYLSLYVNGIHLVTVQDSELTSGDVGLIAGSFDDPGISVRFNKFSVLMP